MLEIRNISKSFGNKKVLDDISFSVGKGEIVSVLGKNGGGKTTLFKTILGILEPDSGTVMLDGRPLKLTETGYLPEERSLYYDCTVFKQLRHFALLKGLKARQADREVEEWLDITDMQEYRDTIPLKLSKGNQQKIQLIVALSGNPSVLVLDEPWTGLDIDNMELFEKLIKREKKENRVILLSSHLHQQVQRICDRFIYIEDGKIRINVTRRELEESENRTVMVTYDRGFYLQDDDILKETYLDNRVRYIIRNEPAAKRIAGFLGEYPEVRGIEIRRMTISDLLEGR